MTLLACRRAACAGLALFLGLALLAAPLRAAEPEGWHAFWSVKGRHGNTLWLLGSVHLMRPEDARPPPNVLRAYGAARRLVLELAVDGGGSMGPPDARLLRLPAGRSLRTELGPVLHDRFSAASASLGLPAANFDSLQPWFAAISFEQAVYSKLGFDASQGVDVQFARRAAQDGKPVVGLETLDEQLGFFASLPMAEQVDLLRETLDEATDIREELEDTVTAWRRGDVAKLAALLARGRAESPALMQKLTTDRNRRWMKQILPLLEGQDDVLVIVGALHLVGDEGLLKLLEQQGYRPTQH